MRLFIENDFLIETTNINETEKALNHWTSGHLGEVIYAYEWEGVTHHDDWVTFLGNMVQSDAEIHLLTKSEAELKQEIKDSAVSYCETVKNRLPFIVEGLLGARPEKEMQELGDLFEGLDFLISSASLLNMETDFQDRHEAVIELGNAFEAQDFVELADLLKYEWLPWLDAYEGKLKSLQLGMHSNGN